MAEARVESIDAIKAFRRALFKFGESSNSALTDSEAEAVGVYRWLEGEQRSYWTSNLRKASELVSRCEDAVRQKKVFKDIAGRPQSAIDEEKALAKARRMKEIAEEKLEHVKRYTARLQREIMLYKGQVQRFATFVASDLPTAAAKLDKIVQTLEAYVMLQAQDGAATAPMAQPTQPAGDVESDVIEPAAGPDAGETEPPKES